MLDFVSGSPNVPFVIQEASNIFDYDELTKYGYSVSTSSILYYTICKALYTFDIINYPIYKNNPSLTHRSTHLLGLSFHPNQQHLVTPIMEAGGRLAMYKLMDMVPPPIRPKPTPKSAPKLVIDRTGKNDQARYTGLKMAMDDDKIAAALEQAQRKTKEGQRLRPKLMEEDYVMPFADKRNVGPMLTPDWTPELLDEEGKKRGRAMAWARQAAAGAFVSDPYETLTVEGSLRVYSAVAALLCALAFGKSTPYALQEWIHVGTNDVLTFFRVPAFAAVVAAIVSGVVNFTMASGKNRSQSVWFIKGLFGGPLAISQLRELNRLSTQGEIDQQSEEINQLAQERRRAAQK